MPFLAVDCFVDLNQVGCTSAFTTKLKFVPCMRQFGNTRAVSAFEQQYDVTPPLMSVVRNAVHVRVWVKYAAP